jgi:carbon starvation protein CstA
MRKWEDFWFSSRIRLLDIKTNCIIHLLIPKGTWFKRGVFAVSEEIEEIESIENKQPSRLLMLAVLLLSITAVAAPVLIARTMLYDEYGYSKNATLTHLVLPGVWSAIILLVIVLIVRTRVAGDLDFIWYRWSRSEVMRAFLLILATPLVYYPTALLMRKLGLPLKED